MHILNELEFGDVLAKVAYFAQTSEAKNFVNSIIPSFDSDEVIKLQKQTEKIYQYRVKFGMPDFLNHHDIRPFIQYAQKSGVLATSDLFLMYETLRVEKMMEEYFAEAEKSIKNDTYFLENDENLRLEMRHVFLDNGTIRDDATKNLQAIRLQIRNLEGRIREVLMRMLRQNANYFSENYITVRENRLVLPVSFEYKNTVKGITHDESQTGQTVYIEPQEVIAMNNDLTKLKSDERNEIFLIRKMLSEKVSILGSTLWHNYVQTLELEVLFAKAAYQQQTNGIIPEFGSTYHIISGRHPLLGIDSIANDIVLDKQTKTLLLSGPNAGGKTVILKQIGLYTLMAQAGIAIPVKEAVIPFYEQVVADIETAQSLSQNLSTFAAHVKRLSEIVQIAGTKTLVLLDEIGTGTDPSEGAALGVGVLQHLKKHGAFTVVSTHYAELKNYGYNEEGVINATLAIEEKTLKPLYQLRIGHAGASHAYYIAKKFNMPSSIVTYLEEEYEKQKQSGILDLEDKLTKLEEERSSVQEQLIQLDQLQKEFEETAKQAEKEQQRLIEEAQKQAEKLVVNKLKEADQLLETLRQKQNSLNFSDYADLKSQSRKLKTKEVKLEKPSETTPLEVGDTVSVISLKTTGKVTAIEKNQYVVQMGILKSTVVRKDLELIQKKQKQAQKARKSLIQVKKEHRSAELDYRGMRLHEVEEIFVSDLQERRALGYNEVRVIHGHGTGVIRNFIQKTVKKQSFVESYRFGMQSEGGVGATIITFK